LGAPEIKYEPGELLVIDYSKNLRCFKFQRLELHSTHQKV